MKLINNPQLDLNRNSLEELFSLISFRILLVSTILLLNACSNTEVSSPRRTIPSAESENSYSKVLNSENSEKLKSDEVQTSDLFIPWKTWEVGLTLNQIRFKDSRIKSADELLSNSRFNEALKTYHESMPVGADEAESLALRIASVELLSSDAPRSVLSLSKFYKNRKQEESQVSEACALFFGYAYGQTRNYEQAFAWFSQALRSKQYFINSRANEGLHALLRIIPNPSLEEMSFVWKSNESISSIISEERSIRQSRAAIILQNSTFFWSPSANKSEDASKLNTSSTDNDSQIKNSSTRKVAALLPLSGRFSKMGDSIKRGIELAAEISLSRGTPFEVIFKDLPGNTDIDSANYTSSSAVVEEVLTQGASVLIGPLLSEQTNEVAQIARNNSVPALILSKNSNTTLGEGIYQFGLTNESQANSLVSSIMRYRSNPRIALIFPNDESGISFISAAREALRQFNVTPISELSYNKGNSGEMLAHGASLESNPPEFVIFGDNLKAAVQFFSSLTPACRKAIIPVGSALWDNPLEVMQSKTILSGAIYVSPFYPDLSKPLVSEFIARYKEKNSKTPDFFAAQGYDVGLLIASDLSSDTTFSPPQSLEGITGIAHSNSAGEILRDLSVLRLAHGTISPITEIPATTPISSIAKEEILNNSENGIITLPPLEDADPSIGQ